ncbi:MAG: hypothetical protein J3Q66DRAFT_375044 [Benniella sp.]|nr:MAG: hypothetical protein J3Q66DRAFT_375044 [Benniella sp.]
MRSTVCFWLQLCVNRSENVCELCLLSSVATHPSFPGNVEETAGHRPWVEKKRLRERPAHKMPSPPTSPKLEYLLTETRGRVAIVTLHRPKALNALCNGSHCELSQVLKVFDVNMKIGAIVLSRSECTFADVYPPLPYAYYD